MARQILDEQFIHPEIRETISTRFLSTVSEAQTAIAAHPVVVIGMKQNPHVRRARNVLAEHGVSFEYIEHGSYFSEWRRRNALKMWTGWPTFPMVFVEGVLVGGADQITALLKAGSVPGQ